MNWEILGSVSELAGALAVLASLLYVGRQVKESSVQTRVNTSSSIASNFQEGWTPIYNSPEVSRIWSEGRRDPSALTQEEADVFKMLFDRQCFNFMTAATAYEDGAYDPELFDSVTALFKVLIHEPGGRFWREEGDVPLTDRAKRHLGIS
jgi:hypothetical protein